MGWRDRFLQASFRGAIFHVPDSTVDGGRRTAVHEFPKKDIPYVEDMGRKARQYSIDAYVLGDDYMSARDTLIAALEDTGSGKLVHPYYGTVDVVCQSWSVRESRSELRMARFTLNFVVTGSLTAPNQVVDTKGDVAAKKLSAIDATKAWLAKAYTLTNALYVVSQNVIDNIDHAFSVIEDAKKVVSAVAAFKRNIDSARGKVLALAYDVTDLAQEISDLLTFGTNEADSFPATAQNVRKQFDEMQSLFEYSPVVSLGDDDPSILVADFVQQNAVINAIGMISIMEFSNVETALEIRQVALEKLDAIMLETDDDDLYIAYEALSSAIIQDIDLRVHVLPKLVEYVPTFHTTSLELTYGLYGSLDNEQDLIDRNKISHPGFIPAAVPLEVLVYE